MLFRRWSRYRHALYRDQRRNIPPPVYHQRRALEHPVPVLPPNEEDVKPNIVGVGQDQLDILDDIFNEEEENVEAENEEEEDDIIQFEEGPDGFPKPIPCTLDYLVKRENDPLSGNIPYNETVRFLHISAHINSNNINSIFYYFLRCRWTRIAFITSATSASKSPSVRLRNSSHGEKHHSTRINKSIGNSFVYWWFAAEQAPWISRY